MYHLVNLIQVSVVIHNHRLRRLHGFSICWLSILSVFHGLFAKGYGFLKCQATKVERASLLGNKASLLSKDTRQDYIQHLRSVLPAICVICGEKILAKVELMIFLLGGRVAVSCFDGANALIDHVQRPVVEIILIYFLQLVLPTALA